MLKGVKWCSKVLKRVESIDCFQKSCILNEHTIRKCFTLVIVYSFLRNCIYCCLCKIYKEKYENVVAIDECSVVVRLAGYKNYRKSSSDILRAVGGKIGKPKHSAVKIHLLGGISRKGLTHLVMFKE